MKYEIGACAQFTARNSVPVRCAGSGFNPNSAFLRSAALHNLVKFLEVQISVILK